MDESPIMQHLRSGQDRLARIGEAVAAFQRLSPADYGPFLASVEAALGGVELGSPALPKLLPAPTPPAAATKPAAAGSLREQIERLLSDGRPRTTKQIRAELAERGPVKRDSLNTEMFNLRKAGVLLVEGTAPKQLHRLASRQAASSGGRERKKRAARDDDEDHRAPRVGASRALLAPSEEIELSRRLEAVEVEIWEQLLASSSAERVREIARDHDPTIDTSTAAAARAGDLDRRCANRAIAELRGDEARAARALAAEADRIRDRYVAGNLGLVPSIIRRYGYHFRTTLTIEDLIQEGNLGLMHAVPRFDHRRGLRFSTFVTWWIRHFVVRATQNSGEVRIPVHLHDLMSRRRTITRELTTELGRAPSPAELCRRLDIPMKTLVGLDRVRLQKRVVLPVGDSVGEDGVAPLVLESDDPSAEDRLLDHEELERVLGAVAELPPQLAEVLRRRFGLGDVPEQTLKEIGLAADFSRERIRQLQEKALAMLRVKLGHDHQSPRA